MLLSITFLHIGPRLTDNDIPKTSVCIEDYITLSESHCGVVHRLVSSLRVDKATGLDGISARLLREGCPEIVPSLAHTIKPFH